MGHNVVWWTVFLVRSKIQNTASFENCLWFEHLDAPLLASFHEAQVFDLQVPPFLPLIVEIFCGITRFDWSRWSVAAGSLVQH